MITPFHQSGLGGASYELRCSSTYYDLTEGGVKIDAKPDDKFQFERHGYFVADRVDHKAEKPVFNLAVGLKDSWGK